MCDTGRDCTMNARNIALAHEYSPMIDRVIGGLKRRSCARDLGCGLIGCHEPATVIHTRTPRGLFGSIGLMAVHSLSMSLSRMIRAPISKVESLRGQRHQPAQAYGIAANALVCPRFRRHSGHD